MGDPHVDTWIPALAVAGAYLLGAIPFGLILAARFAGIDVRSAGSGNIGATNVARSAGKGLGVVTLALDALKGAVPVLVAERVLHLPIAVVAAAGLAAVLGHVFPIYLGFRGGKGVATGAGVFAAIAPLPAAIAAGVFAGVFAVGRVVSLGSLVASLALIGAIVALDGRREVITLGVVVVALIVLRHTGNIQRLLSRSEKGL